MIDEEYVRIRRGENPNIYPMVHSRLALYKRCPAWYKFQYLDRLPRTSGEAAELGSVAHDFLEIYATRGLEAAKLFISAMLPLTKHAELKKIQEAISQIN